MTASMPAYDPAALQAAIEALPPRLQHVASLVLRADFAAEAPGDGVLGRITAYAEQELAAASGTEERERFRVYSAADALQPQPPIDWIVERLVSPGATELWAGAGGSKKTYSLLDMAVCVASGRPWLGMRVRQAPVLIIDEESGPRRMARRLGEVLRGHDAGPETPIHYVSLALFNFRDRLDLSHLHDLIAELGAELVVIDALVDVMPGADENAAGDVHPVFQGLRSVADATRSNIIVVHHHNKIGGYRGSSAMKGAVDFVINVTSKPGENVVKFECEKSRDAEEFKWAAEARWVDDTFDLAPADLEDGGPSFSRAERYVLRHLQEHGASTTTDIQGCADSCSPDSARRAIYSLADRGYVEKVSPPGERPGTYALSEKGLQCER